jgi:deoxyribonuclease V
VTVRPLVAEPTVPAPEQGSASPIAVDDEVVGYAVRTRAGARAVFAHAAWRTSPEVARDLVLLTVSGRSRTPEPIRLARRLARTARAEDR